MKEHEKSAQSLDLTEETEHQVSKDVSILIVEEKTGNNSLEIIKEVKKSPKKSLPNFILPEASQDQGQPDKSESSGSETLFSAIAGKEVTENPDNSKVTSGDDGEERLPVSSSLDQPSSNNEDRGQVGILADDEASESFTKYSGIGLNISIYLTNSLFKFWIS